LTQIQKNLRETPSQKKRKPKIKGYKFADLGRYKFGNRSEWRKACQQEGKKKLTTLT